MRAWPSDGSTVDFGDLVEPLRTALGFCYSLTRKNATEDVPYDGYDIGDSIKHVCFSADERLTAFQMSYDETEQGRDAAEVILSLAVQLGYEQGRRSVREELREPLRHLQRAMRTMTIGERTAHGIDYVANTIERIR